MKQIRSNVFETNSSSTHSIAVPNKLNNYDGRSISFNLGEFEWEFGEADPEDYLYTAICCMPSYSKYLNRLEEILKNHNIDYSFIDEPIFSQGGYLTNGDIDHDNKLVPFVKDLLASDDRTLAFIFDGIVLTGNDNADGDERAYLSPMDKEYIDLDGDRSPNPYYKEELVENYDWYYKGN